MPLSYKKSLYLSIVLIFFLIGVFPVCAGAITGSQPAVEIFVAGKKFQGILPYKEYQELKNKSVHLPGLAFSDEGPMGVVTLSNGYTFDPLKGKTLTLGVAGKVKVEQGVGRPDLGLTVADLTYDPEKGKTLEISQSVPVLVPVPLGKITSPVLKESVEPVLMPSFMDTKVAGVSPSFRQVVEAFSLGGQMPLVPKVTSSAELEAVLEQKLGHTTEPALLIYDKKRLRVMTLQEIPSEGGVDAVAAPGWKETPLLKSQLDNALTSE